MGFNGKPNYPNMANQGISTRAKFLVYPNRFFSKQYLSEFHPHPQSFCVATALFLLAVAGEKWCYPFDFWSSACAWIVGGLRLFGCCEVLKGGDVHVALSCAASIFILNYLNWIVLIGQGVRPSNADGTRFCQSLSIFYSGARNLRLYVHLAKGSHSCPCVLACTRHIASLIDHK